MAAYEIWLSRDTGARLALLDTIQKFDYAIVTHDIGACVLVLDGSFDTSLLVVDNRIEVWRAPEGGSLLLERVYMIRQRQRKTDSSGKTSIIVTALDGNYLLDGRIVAYPSGSSQAMMSGPADDLCKAIVYDALGADAVVARRIATTYFSVYPALAAGPSLVKSFPWRNVLTTLQEIAQAADEAGTPVYWDVVPINHVKWEFQTRTGQPGQDHSYPSGSNPVLLGLEYGNLAEPALDEDYTKEATIAYVNTRYAEDTARSGRSIFGRREVYADARSATTALGEDAIANARLREGRPRRRFTAKIVDSVGTRYGVHWRQGDKVSAFYEHQQFNCIVSAIHVKVDGDGKETIEARVDVQE